MTIKQIQCLLAYLGYDSGEIDGVNGKNTQAAVRAFQSQEGLAVDGIAGAKTQAALKDAVANGRFKADELPSSGHPPDKTGTFWDEIQYFTREEFRCQCGGKYCNGFPAEPQELLLRQADRLRKTVGPMRLSSGLRCKTHNAEVGGVSNSRHLSGKAMDFCVTGKTSAQLLAEIKKLPKIRYAYAINANYVHMDIE